MKTYKIWRSPGGASIIIKADYVIIKDHSVYLYNEKNEMIAFFSNIWGFVIIENTSS